MKRIQLFFGVIMASLVMLTACNEDLEPEAPRIIGDVFVRCQLSGTDTVYAPFYTAYANRLIKSAEVKTTDGGVVNLTKYSAMGDVFRKIPVATDYNKAKVAAGNYQFKVVTQEGQTLETTDKLMEKTYAPVKITKFEYDKKTHSFKIEWDEIKDMDIILVKLKQKMDGIDYFTTQRLAPTTTKYEFNVQTPGWRVNQIEDDSSCTLIVSAYKFTETTQKTWYQIEWQSFATKDIKW